jgi:uroporphyrinogen-III synthase
MSASHGVLVTRPLRQVGGTLDALRAAGHRAQHLPLLSIAPLSSPQLDEALARYPRADIAIFVSANAVEFGLAALAKRNIATTGPRVAAIGAATADRLRAGRVAVDLVPVGGHDSERLLAHPAFQDVKANVILIFRGDSERGGRHTLAEMLTARGAEVIAATCYRRDPALHDSARIQAIATALSAGELNVIQVMSGESLDALLALFGNLDALRKCLLLVPHARIAEAARAAGFDAAVVTGLGDDALIGALASVPIVPTLDPSACHPHP